VDLLVDAGASRVVVVGVSKGAEGALHLAVVDDRVDGVVALSPSSVSWANLGRCAACRRTPRR
jgi:S-formylglutathione hydrolase FrmB